MVDKLEGVIQSLIWQMPVPENFYTTIGWRFMVNYNNQEYWFKKGDRVLKTYIRENELFSTQCYQAYSENTMKVVK